MRTGLRILGVLAQWEEKTHRFKDTSFKVLCFKYILFIFLFCKREMYFRKELRTG